MSVAVHTVQVKQSKGNDNDDIWYDCESEFDIDTPTVADMIEAGVPAERAEGVASLAALVGAHAMEPLCDPLTLLRFHISSQGNVKDALSMYRGTLKWRSDFSVGLAMAMHGAGETYCKDGNACHLNGQTEWRWERRASVHEAVLFQRHAFVGRLKELNPADGGPILVWRPGIADVAALEEEDVFDAFKRGLASHLEDCFQCSRAASLRRKQLVLSRLVIDVHGMNARFIRHIKLIQKLVDFSTHYPEAVSTITVVRAPWLATKLWQASKRFIPPRTQAKFVILGNDFASSLKEHSGLDLAMLPEFLGGQKSDKVVCSAEWVPRGTGAAIRERQGKITGVPFWFSTT